MEEKGADLMSSLPNEILQHILSMVSFKEAVQTSALSTSWRSLMSPSCVHIDISNSTIHHQLLPIIKSWSESGNAFQTLKLYLASSDVAFAVCTKGVHGELTLHFSEQYYCKQQKQKQKQLLLSVLPSSLPREYCFSLIMEQSRSLDPCSSSFSFIKILHLRSVSHLVGDVVSDLCSRCLALESLKIEKCSGLESIEIKSGVKNLEMADCADIVRVVVSAHKLTSFSYKGVFPILQLLNVPNLVDVTFNFGDGLGRNNSFDCEDALSLLSSVKDIESLKITTWLIQSLCCAGVIFNKLDFQFSRLKKLELIIGSKISSQTRDSFACFLHTAPTLEELFLKKEVEQQSAEIPFTYQHWHEPHLWKDYATVKNDACRLKYMKKISIVGFTMEKDELLWMDLLLHTAINLKEMILDHSWRVAIIPFTHLPYIKHQYFLLPCPHLHSYFVLILDSPPKLSSSSS